MTYIYNGTQNAWSSSNLVHKAEASNITALDNLVITKYGGGTISFVRGVIGKLKTSTLYLPEPKTTDEASIADAIASMLSAYGTDLFIYRSDAPLAFGEYNFHPVLREPFRTGEPSDVSYTIKYKENYYSYFSSGSYDYDLAFCQILSMQSDYIIFGSHGGRSMKENSFGTTSSTVKAVYYREAHPLTEDSISYFNKKAVPIIEIGTAIELRR